MITDFQFNVAMGLTSCGRHLFDFAFHEFTSAYIRHAEQFLAADETVGRFNGTSHGWA